jgi:DNA ligase-1
MATELARLAELHRKLAETSSRIEKASLLESMLRSLEPNEVEAAVHLLLGHPLGPRRQGDLEVGGRTVAAALENLGAPDGLPLTLLEVRARLERIAEVQGEGSKQGRRTLMQELLRRATVPERELLIAAIFSELRQGVKEGVMLNAVARASGVAEDELRRAVLVSGDLGALAARLVGGNGSALAELGVSIFQPLQPMLATVATSITQVLDEHGGETALEFKLDGGRVQIHKRGDEVRLYSRHRNEITDSLPDIVALGRSLRAHELIVEGEVIAVGRDGRPLPFQELMRRFRRVHALPSTMEQLPLQLLLFDALKIDGQSLLDHTTTERHQALASVADAHLLAPRLVCRDPQEAEHFLAEALARGHEGLMAKALDSRYEPGARGKHWFKIKPAETLDLAIIGAEWGHGRRQGWLSNYHLGARDPEREGVFHMLGKTFKGLTDVDLERMTQVLLATRLDEHDGVVLVRPTVVAEIAFNEIQRSPRYPSGLALRFARVKSFRLDKTPAEADTLGQVEQLYRRQFDRKSEAP